MASQAGLHRSGGLHLRSVETPKTDIEHRGPQAGHTQQLHCLACGTFACLCPVVPLSNASTMTAAGAAAETMPFRRGCGLRRRICFFRDPRKYPPDEHEGRRSQQVDVVAPLQPSSSADQIWRGRPPIASVARTVAPSRPFRAGSLLVLRRDTRSRRPEPSALIARCNEGRSPIPAPR